MFSWILEAMGNWIALLPLLIVFVIVWTLVVGSVDIYKAWRDNRIAKRVKERNEFIGTIDPSNGDGDDSEY